MPSAPGRVPRRRRPCISAGRTVGRPGLPRAFPSLRARIRRRVPGTRDLRVLGAPYFVALTNQYVALPGHTELSHSIGVPAGISRSTSHTT